MIGELLVLYNTLFNYFLLKFTKEITGLYVKKRRLVFSAFVSGLVSSVLYQSFAGAVLSFVLLIGLAFSFRVQTLLKQGTVLLIATFFIGGLLTSLLPFLLRQSDLIFFIFCLSIAVLSLTFIHSKWRNMVKEKLQQSFLVDCELELFQQTFSLKGFIDTGNECVEPISGKPVHFLSYRAVEEKLPEELKKGLLTWDDNNPYQLTMFPSFMYPRIRVLTLSTVQKETSNALAFRFDRLVLYGNIKKEILDEYVVFTRHDARFPQNAQMILHILALN
ncbi:sigma-E processing peptidase SpoIIGA [Ureibacillus sp. FSL K6-8385]|uniref:Sporulation protein n=1 Tax=Ureibacillus terrenus TaxID=118246 RepID=A0A540V4B1_9BACL|nr:sigma-E processing peptidase SpoIIGA [Ureibacillus terrenus]MED3660322.1 sigma-E processing peptidase SpoIIGA [Ureibacillus terrenus]MED3762478.1 sigma-E processing peptidase SpoIIGA [Ureibacillus terrenus]TQE91548.1 sporulation protein [Ureibacillus terrenus]